MDEKVGSQQGTSDQMGQGIEACNADACLITNSHVDLLY